MAGGIFGMDGRMPIVGDNDEPPEARRMRLKMMMRIPPVQPDAIADALQAVHQYFRMKTAQALESATAVALLAELRQRNRIAGDALDRFDNREQALALGLLAQAGFCDVWPDAVSITIPGEEFLAWFETQEGDDDGQATGDPAKA